MWSAWRRGSASLYLGVGVVLFREPGGAETVMAHAPTWPVDRVLGQLGAAREAAGHTISKPGRPLKVSLSAAHSPAVWCSFPAGVLGWQEREALRTHEVCTAMQMEPQDLRLSSDPDHGAICSGMAQSLFAALTTWASEAGFELSSVKPLWAEATQSGHAAAHRTVVVTEPGAATVLSDGNAWSAVNGDVSRVQEGDVAHLQFTTAQGPELPAAPTVWNRHWVLS